MAEIQRRVLAHVEAEELSVSTGIQTLAQPTAGKTIVAEYESLGKTDFWLLDEWYHLPLLNLVTTYDFKDDPAIVAKRLNIDETRVRDSIRRLCTAGYLTIDESGKLQRTQLKVRFPTQRSHTSVRRFHRAMVEKAAALLQGVPTEKDFNERLISAVTFAGDPEKINAAKVIIEEAMYKAAEVLADSETCSEIFQLNLQLFKLTRSSSGD